MRPPASPTPGPAVTTKGPSRAVCMSMALALPTHHTPSATLRAGGLASPRVPFQMCLLAKSNCNTLQHTATHCNTLQRTATHCNTLQHTATHCNTLQRTCIPSRAISDTTARQAVATLLARCRSPADSCPQILCTDSPLLCNQLQVRGSAAIFFLSQVVASDIPT